MKYQVERIYDGVKPDTVEKIIMGSLPENSWLIPEHIKFVSHLNNCNSIIEDLEYTEFCVNELMNIREREIITGRNANVVTKRALFSNSIVTYARCFNYSKKGGRNPLDKKHFKRVTEKKENINIDDLISFHEHIMTLRNSFIAHADKNPYESNRAFIEFEYDGHMFYSIFTNISSAMHSFHDDEMDKFKILIEHLLKIVETKKIRLIDKVKKEIGIEKLEEIGLGIAKMTKASNTYSK